MRILLLSVLVCLVGCQGAPPETQTEETPLVYDIGAIARPITTSSPEAQLWFNRGLGMAYGFNHEEAAACFERAAEALPHLDNTLIAFNHGAAFASDGVTTAVFACCDLFGNAAGDWIGAIADQLGQDGNFSGPVSKFVDADLAGDLAQRYDGIDQLVVRGIAFEPVPYDTADIVEAEEAAGGHVEDHEFVVDRTSHGRRASFHASFPGIVRRD